MKRFLLGGMIAAIAVLSCLPAEAQTSGKRIVYCRPRPFCANGQINVCQVFGDADDACACKQWSQCFGPTRSAPTLPPSVQQPRPGTIPPRIDPRPVR